MKKITKRQHGSVVLHIGTNNMDQQITQERKYLYSHTTPETAFVAENYPWGFRLRTTIRYWVETKKAKNGGQRFARQTINPKTGKWCAIKYSTYSPIMIMFLDHNDHIHSISLDHNDGEERILKFKETHLSSLNEYQKDRLKEMMAYNEVMKHVTFKIVPNPIGPVSLFSSDPIEIEKRKLLLEQSEKREQEKREEEKKINRAIAYHYSKIQL